MNDIVLSAEKISKSFKDVKVVNDLSFELKKGDIFGFIGPNGAGKTTTIRMLLGLLKPDSGSIYINNYSIIDEYYKAIDSVGALVEGPAFYEYMTAQENLECFSVYSGCIDKKRIKYLLELVGLADRANDKVKNFSLGMKQRLGIAQALLNNPKLLILDEPTNGLDPNGMKDIRKLVKDLSNKGITIFISSHMLSEVQNICNKILIIKDGKKIAFENTSDLVNQSELYEIMSTDKDNLLNVLNSIKEVSILEVNEKVKIKIERNMLPEDLLEKLIKSGVKIRLYNPITISLEDHFFNLIKGE